MEKQKLEVDELISLADLNGIEAFSPDSCSGDACDAINLQATFNPARTVRSIKISNSSAKSVKVTLDWADPFGYCGVSNSDTITPRGNVEFFAPSDYNPGYCKIKAIYR